MTGRTSGCSISSFSFGVNDGIKEVPIKIRRKNNAINKSSFRSPSLGLAQTYCTGFLQVALVPHSAADPGTVHLLIPARFQGNPHAYYSVLRRRPVSLVLRFKKSSVIYLKLRSIFAQLSRHGLFLSVTRSLKKVKTCLYLCQAIKENNTLC